MPRLLVCRECQTIETLPLYDGPKELEAQDPLLDNVVRRHVQKHGNLRTDVAALLVADDTKACNCPRCRGDMGTFWDMHRDEILKGLGERWTGLHPIEFYAVKDGYLEDAMRCYNRHHRPQGADCIDWLSHDRKLTPDTWPQDKSVYLCHFCPVASSVTTEIRWKKGRYRKEPGETE